MSRWRLCKTQYYFFFESYVYKGLFMVDLFYEMKTWTPNCKAHKILEKKKYLVIIFQQWSQSSQFPLKQYR